MFGTTVNLLVSPVSHHGDFVEMLHLCKIRM